MSPPTITVSGEPLFESWTSAAGFTVVSAPARSLDESGSGVVVATVAVLVTLGIAARPALATIVTVTSLAAPAATVPRLQVTVAVPEQLPAVVEADTYVRPAGRVSETLTPAAALGPLLWTVRV